MSYTYSDRKHGDSAVPPKGTAPGQPSMDALRSGAAKPTAEQMGRRVDLPDVMRAKMESAFGADLGAVKLYESQAVADAGAKAVSQGPNIAFAPGLLDFSSFGGQALLGHEISHVVSQARGEVTGGGFLNDHALEARADREGAMAAAGETVAMPTASLSAVTAADAAGPMQAKDKLERKNEAVSEANRIQLSFTRNRYNNDPRLKHNDDFDSLVQGASHRTMREISRRARAEREKYDRQSRGIFTMEEEMRGDNDSFILPERAQRMRDNDLMLYLNLERAAKAARKGQSYTVSRNMGDFR